VLAFGAVVLACAESYGFLGIAIVAPKFTIESRHRYHQALKACFVKEINQIGKYEAGQTSQLDNY